MSSFRFKCLILDHDETCVASTQHTHYPSFVEGMQQLRPELKPMTLEEFRMMNYDPGFVNYVLNDLKLSEEEFEQETEIWRKWTRMIDPPFYDGLLDLIREFRKRGGVVAICTHSESDTVLRHYKAAQLDENIAESDIIIPDAVYGWELGPGKYKPETFTVDDLIEKYGFKREEMVMVDDLPPGIEMAKTAGICSIGVTYGYELPPLRKYLEKNCTYVVNSVPDLQKLVLDSECSVTKGDVSASSVAVQVAAS